MSTINLLPEDYLHRRAQQRANILCLGLFSVVMASVVGAAVVGERKARETRQVREQINREYEEAGRLITQLQQLEAKKQQVLAKAQVASELRERVLRSYLLASVTNAMSEGMAIRALNLTTTVLHSEPAKPAATAGTKFQSRGVLRDKAPEPASDANRVQTAVQLEVIGLAKTDVQVAQFISRMSANALVQSVDLEYSAEADYQKVKVREFKVIVNLKPGAQLEGDMNASARRSAAEPADARS